MEKRNKSRKMTLVLFAIYIVVLIWIILFKFQFGSRELPHLRGINLIPFAGSAIVNGKVDLSEIIQNVLIFIPFGVYVSMLKPNWSFWKKAAPAACVSLLFEILQFIFAIGATDITDLIDNTLGGILGCIIYIVFSKVCKEKTNKVLNIFALIGTAGMVLLMGLLIVANL